MGARLKAHGARDAESLEPLPNLPEHWQPILLWAAYRVKVSNTEIGRKVSHREHGGPPFEEVRIVPASRDLMRREARSTRSTPSV